MLWYKAWRETQTRFAIIAVVLIAFCLFAVFFYNRAQLRGLYVTPDLRAANYSEHIYRIMYSGTAKGAFAMLVIFLGLGGLLRERANRTVFFTMALPVSRLQLLGTQIAAVIAEMAVLSLMPAILIPLLSLLLGLSYPFTQALHFGILWFTCGSVILALAFLLSVVLPGEYTAPAVCYVVLMLQALVADWKPLKPYRTNLFWTMGEFGRMHWGARHNLLMSDSLPWERLLMIMLIAFGMFALAVRVSQKQEF